MLVGRCSSELSGRKLHRKIKKSQTLRLRNADDIRGKFGAAASWAALWGCVALPRGAARATSFSTNLFPPSLGETGEQL
jgi:hypothetical protein